MRHHPGATDPPPSLRAAFARCRGRGCSWHADLAVVGKTSWLPPAHAAILREQVRWRNRDGSRSKNESSQPTDLAIRGAVKRLCPTLKIPPAGATGRRGSRDIVTLVTKLTQRRSLPLRPTSELENLPPASARLPGGSCSRGKHVREAWRGTRPPRSRIWPAGVGSNGLARCASSQASQRPILKEEGAVGRRSCIGQSHGNSCKNAPE